MESRVLPDKAVRKLLTDHFVFVKVDSRKPSEEAAKILSQVKADGIPLFIYLGPDGKVLSATVGFRDVAEFKADLEANVWRGGDAAAKDVLKNLAELVAQAEQDLKAKKYGAVVRTARDIESVPGDTDPHRRMREILGKALEAGRGLLGNADALVQSGKKSEAAAILRTVQHDFRGTPVGVGADAALAKLGEAPAAPPVPERTFRPLRAFKKLIDPWEHTPVGSWYRFRVTRGDEEGFVDVGLTSNRPDPVVSSQQSRKGQAGPVQSAEVKPTIVQIVAEDVLVIEGQKYPCLIRNPIDAKGVPAANVKEWVLKDGRHAGSVLRLESPQKTLVATKVWSHTIKIRGKELECLVVEADLTADGKTQAVKTSYDFTVPQPIRIESEGVSTVLVDLGDDWSRRPPFPGSK